MQRVVELTDTSVATSGDYRNFRVVDGRRVDHVIDPRSGLPADNDVASATVIHRSAMAADAYATAIMVLGETDGLAFADEHGLPALLIIKEDSSTEFRERYNALMKPYLVAR